jgi:hypothetical protein
MNKLDMLFIKAKNKVHKVVNPVRHAEIKEEIKIHTDRMHRTGQISFFTNDKGVKMIKPEYAGIIKHNMKEGWVRLIPNFNDKVMFDVNDESLAYIDVLAKEAGDEKFIEIIDLMMERKFESESPWGIELMIDQETNTFKVYADRERSKFL